MTPEELQEVVAAVIAALKTNSKTIDQLTAVTTLADTDNLEISGGKKVSFGNLKELVASSVVPSSESIKGWVIIEDTDELPENPTQEEQEIGYLLDTTLYVYVGEGGDTLDGKYQSVDMQGPQGETGPAGADGHDGVDLGEVALVNNLIEGGEESALTAEMGKELNEKIENFNGFRTSAKRTLTMAKDGNSSTVKRSNYPLYKDSLVHIKATMSSSKTGKTYFYGKVDSTQTGQRVLFNIPAGETSAEADIVVDKLYNFLTVWNANSANLTSTTITLEITHKVKKTGNDSIANDIQLVTADSYDNWRRNAVYTPVKKGDILWFSGYGTAGAVFVGFRESTYFNPEYTKEIWNEGSNEAVCNEAFIAFDKDGYIFVQSRHVNMTPQAVLYTDRVLNEDIIISASNTPKGIADKADYHCSGTNDETLLNALFQGAVYLNKKVRLLRGDYYVDSLTKTYYNSNDTFLLVDTSPLNNNLSSGSFILHGENPSRRPVIHVSDTAYEALTANSQYVLLGIYDSSTYGGFVEIKNVLLRYPSNQKKICALDFTSYGGYARLHSISLYAYTNGYNGQQITISNPPAVAVEGCIGLCFIGKGPNGAYGSEITDMGASGFYEGIAINTEWTICSHVYSIFCVYGWVFGKYGKNQGVISSATHPLLLLNCGDERDVNLPKFYANSGLQDIEMYAFSVERNAANTPGLALGLLATEGTQGTFRGVINYNTGQGSGNSVNVGFWEYGHGHGMKTTDTSHAQSGTTSTRNTYRPNFMQRYWDTTLGKEVICVDEENGVWKDAAGNTV